MKKLCSHIIIQVTICFCCHFVLAQDPHFSQYFSSPLSFNPALTGYFEGDHRLSINFRNQWANISDPYTTGTLSYDTKIMKNRIGANDRWGLGVLALYDQSSGGIYKNTYLSLSTAFQKGLDEYGDQSIGLGVQATYAGSAVDFTKITYSNQFTGSGFDLGIPSGETIHNQSIHYFDLNAGLLYNFKDDAGNQFTFGAGMYHILKPKLSFFSAQNQSLQPRYTLHAGGNFPMGQTDNLFVSAHFMQQAGNNEYVVGGAYGAGIGNSEMSIYLGAWLRAGDAFYPYAGIRGKDFQLGLTYDITRSDISRIQRYSGSSEISFLYYFTNGERKKGIPCFF
ncbi:MAG: PorP/SprF family type IX secretion system membrane protein [Bacteroidota bacterium]|nr:PorP/SprF family type IX secretion system membrane protein [Bacteroidota bacterium]